MSKSVRISLANKCQLLFGAAVILILSAALTVGWLRMKTLVQEGQEQTARKLANAWLTGKIELGSPLATAPETLLETEPQKVPSDLSLILIEKEDFQLWSTKDPFFEQALSLFQLHPHQQERFKQITDSRGNPAFRFARAIRKSDRLKLTNTYNKQVFTPDIDTSQTANPLEMILLLQYRSELASQQLMLNRLYIVAAGLLAGLLAIGVFWFITTRIILSPVRLLRTYAAKVSEGDLNIRSDINTGDEFEQLSNMFNTMLDRLKANQDKLYLVNKSLDLKLGELSETNVALYEANKI